MARMIGYSRVSTDEQSRNGHGMEAQREAIDRLAAHHLWTIEHVADEAASGKHINPGLRDTAATSWGNEVVGDTGRRAASTIASTG